MRKSMISIGLTTLLLAGLSLDASADRDRNGKHWDRGDSQQRWDHRHQQQRQWRKRQARQWRNSGYAAPPRYRQHRGWRVDRFNRFSRFGHPSSRYNRNWRNDRYWGWPLGPVGGAVIGSAITYSLVHDHNDHRDCDHAVGERHEITGCYRIEQLPDGRERRVELPRSACQ